MFRINKIAVYEPPPFWKDPSKSTGLCNRRGSKTLETAHPEKPTSSGFRAKNYKIRLGSNVLIPLNPKFQVD